jgi:predicted nucleic acid-binding protein
VTLFVDSSALYAAVDADDRHNERARQVLEAGEPLVTSDHVLVETWLLLQRRLGAPTADRFWGGIRDGGAAVELVGSADLEVAWAIGEAFPDQGFSIVDRTSFAVMQRLGVHRAATFDDHFAVFRFGRNRERAFEPVR